MSSSLLYKIALTKIPKVGPITAKSLISYCGGAAEVFDTKLPSLLQIPNVGQGIARSILKKDSLKEAEKELAFADKIGIQIISYLHEAYPKRLLNYEDSPILLYYRGNADLNAPRTVAIVGTRTPTDYGMLQCEKIVAELRLFEPQIISGLAYGIDAIAHREALQNDMETIAVLGHGLNRIYPSANRNLAIEIQNHGGLLTEFGKDTNPDRENFPMRNRIIAAQSDVIIVIESATRGGSIITAEYGNAYSKDVFALPGRVTDNRSGGTNKLIKQHKANLIESAADIAYIMRWEEMDGSKQMQNSLFPVLDEKEELIYKLLKETSEQKIDQLHLQLNIPLNVLAEKLLAMEFKGIVKSLPGKRYRLI